MTDTVASFPQVLFWSVCTIFNTFWAGLSGCSQVQMYSSAATLWRGVILSAKLCDITVTCPCSVVNTFCLNCLWCSLHGKSSFKGSISVYFSLFKDHYSINVIPLFLWSVHFSWNTSFNCSICPNCKKRHSLYLSCLYTPFHNLK